MKNYFKHCMPGLLTVVLSFSCNESEVSILEQPDEQAIHEKVLIKDEARDELVASIAQNLANGLQNESLRSFIKEKTIKKFDGDYNFLVQSSKDEEISVEVNGRIVTTTLGDVLANTQNSGRPVDDFLSSLGELHPLLQVALPQLATDSAESWYIENEVPLVAFVPSDHDESRENAIIPAYDFEGNYYELSSKEEPEKLVIVISDNERLLAIEKMTSSGGRIAQEILPIDECLEPLAAYYESETHLYYLKEEAYPIINNCQGGGGGGGTGGGGSGGGSDECDRERKDLKDFINKAQFASYDIIRGVETWASGKPEVRLFVAFARANTGSTFTFTGLNYYMGEENWFHRKWLKEIVDVKNFDYQIVNWDPEIYGDRMYYIWIEEDPSLFNASLDVGVITTFNFLNQQIANSTTVGTAKFSIGSADDVIAAPVPVEYCDNTDGEGTEYRTPMIFWINQQQ